MLEIKANKMKNVIRDYTNKIKKETVTQFNKKDLYCLYCQTALLHNIHNTSHFPTVQHAIMSFFFFLIAITKMMTIYMYTTLLQVISITCVEINSTDKKTTMVIFI